MLWATVEVFWQWRSTAPTDGSIVTYVYIQLHFGPLPVWRTALASASPWCHSLCITLMTAVSSPTLTLGSLFFSVKKLIFHILEWLSSMSKISLLLYASPLIFVSSDINPPLQQLNIKGLSVLLGPPSKTASTNYSCSCTAQEIGGKLLLWAHSEWDCQRGMKNWGNKGDSIAWWGSLPMAMTYMNTQLCCLFFKYMYIQPLQIQGYFEHSSSCFTYR